MRRGLPVLLLLIALSSGCAHQAVLAKGECTVDFHGARLNGSPVQVLHLKDGGHPFQLEMSVFAYEIDPPLQAVQSVAYVTPEEPGVSWSPPDRSQLAATLGQLLPMFARNLPGGKCEPAPEDAGAPSVPEGRCEAHLGGKTLLSRVRLFPGERGLIIQYASWLTPKGRTWTDRFWASIHVSPPAPAKSTVAQAIPVEALAVLARGSN